MYVHVQYVLDRSASMNHLADATIAGFNEFITEQKAVPGHCTFGLVLFDHEYLVCGESSFRDISEVPLLSRETYVPRGSTALLDAIGRAMDEVGTVINMLPAAAQPEKVVMVIHTDGEENCSKGYTLARIKQMIEHAQHHNWEFVFMGANMDAIAVGTSMGIASINTMTFAANAGGMSASYGSSSANLRSLRTESASSMAFSDADRAAQKKAGA